MYCGCCEKNQCEGSPCALKWTAPVYVLREWSPRAPQFGWPGHEDCWNPPPTDSCDIILKQIGSLDVVDRICGFTMEDQCKIYKITQTWKKIYHPDDPVPGCQTEWDVIFHTFNPGPIYYGVSGSAPIVYYTPQDNFFGNLSFPGGYYDQFARPEEPTSGGFGFNYSGLTLINQTIETIQGIFHEDILCKIPICDKQVNEGATAYFINTKTNEIYDFEEWWNTELPISSVENKTATLKLECVDNDYYDYSIILTDSTEIGNTYISCVEISDCCFGHTYDNCQYDICSEAVCAIDSHCCSTSWDSICVNIAIAKEVCNDVCDIEGAWWRLVPPIGIYGKGSRQIVAPNWETGRTPYVYRLYIDHTDHFDGSYHHHMYHITNAEPNPIQGCHYLVTPNINKIIRPICSNNCPPCDPTIFNCSPDSCCEPDHVHIVTEWTLQYCEGACCVDGVCHTSSTEITCANDGGVWQGRCSIGCGVECGSPIDISGACCIPNTQTGISTCSVMLMSECSLVGFWNGSSSCNTNPITGIDPCGTGTFGACCFSPSSSEFGCNACRHTTDVGCQNIGGVFHSNRSCGPGANSPCSRVCCFGGDPSQSFWCDAEECPPGSTNC